MLFYTDYMATEILKTMGKRVRVLREEKGLNQIELAAEVRRRGVECSNSMISSVETGRANPSLEVFVAIADVLDVTLDYLATRTERIESPNAPDVPVVVPVGVSEEAEHAAGIIDDLPPSKRAEVLDVLLAMVRHVAPADVAKEAAPPDDLRAERGRFSRLINSTEEPRSGR